MILGAAILNSCKKSDVIKPQITDPLTTTHYKLHDQADGVWDVLGFGYDVTYEYANENSSTFKVLDIDRIKVDYPDRVVTDLSNYTDFHLTVGTNAQAFSDSLSVKASGTLGVPILKNVFSSSISASFSGSNKFSSKWIYGNYSLIVQKKRLKTNASIDLLKTYLNPTFLADLQAYTPQNLVNKYGTHVMVDIILGGKLDVMYQGLTNNSNRLSAGTSAISYGVKDIFNMTADQYTTRAESSTNSLQTLHYKTIGGDAAKSLTPGDIVLGSATQTINIANWQSSITVANSQLIDFNTNSLIPIYEFISDPTKKAQIKAYVDQYLYNRQVRLTPDPTYMYFNAGQGDHFTTPVMANYGIGWQYYDNEFNAYLSPVTGAMPVYEFYDTYYHNHYNSTNPNAVAGYPNWINHGITYYAYTTQVPGTIPIYLYYNPQTHDHYVTPIASGFSGWQNYGIAFYAFPKVVQ